MSSPCPIDACHIITTLHKVHTGPRPPARCSLCQRRGTCALAKTHLAASMNNFSGEFSSQTVVVLVAITDGMAITSTISSNLR